MNISPEIKEMSEAELEAHKYFSFINLFILYKALAKPDDTNRLMF